MTIDRHKYLSPDELATLRQKTEESAILSQNQAMLWLLIDISTQTGLRVSELAKITLADIDLSLNTLQVHRSKKRGKKSKDFLPISPALSAHLTTYLPTIPNQTPKTPLFHGQRGPLTRRGLQQAWASAVKQAGLTRSPSIHSARHTLAVELLKKTKNLRLIQKQLGHTNINTTASIYADVPWDDQQSAINSLFPCHTHA